MNNIEHYLEVAKECGAAIVKSDQEQTAITFFVSELESYTAHILADKEALIAMQAKALRDVRDAFLGLQPDFGGPISQQMGKAVERINDCLYASAESVAAWEEANKLKSPQDEIDRLKQQVVMKSQQTKRLVWLHQQLRRPDLHIESIREFQKEVNDLEFEINNENTQATAESVAENESLQQQIETGTAQNKELWGMNNTLQQQVAMLVDSIKQNAIRSGFVGMLEPWASVVLHNTQATAEAYEREVAAKANAEFIAHLRKMPSIGLSERQFGELLRAAKNGGVE